MSNRTDFETQAVELMELFDSWTDTGQYGNARAQRLETELRNAFVAGQEEPRVQELEHRLAECLGECERLLRATSADRVRELEAALQSLLKIRDGSGYQSREEQAIYTTAQVILNK